MSDKVYRIFVVIMLALLVLCVSINMFQEEIHSTKCDQAFLTAKLSELLTDYQKDVYATSVKNINQQMFIQGEYQFETQVDIAFLVYSCSR